jgi:hypothetical protein
MGAEETSETESRFRVQHSPQGQHDHCPWETARIAIHATPNAEPPFGADECW